MRVIPSSVRRTVVTPVLLLAVATAGCYHATVETGQQPSGEIVENEWAHSFIGGLIPPSTVNTAAECTNGVAVVETQHSVLNMIAQFITFSLYSPMTITVQCASGGGAFDRAEADTEYVIDLPTSATRAELSDALNRAARTAADRNEAVFVDFKEDL